MVRDPDGLPVRKEMVMDLGPILIPRSTRAALVMLLFVIGTVSAQDVPPVSPPLTMKPGTILTVRINEPLSSDYSQVGDVFSATLTQPVIAQGILVSRYGQTAAGRVVESKKAGRVPGVSRLGIALTILTLVDGQTVPIQSQLLVREGPTSVGHDAAVVAGTTGLGAAIGAAAAWGKGAAIGAGIGAAAGTIGVLLTRGYPTIVEPETLLTTSPVTIETNSAPQAFRFVEPADYASSQIPPQHVLAYPPPIPPAYPHPYYPLPFYPYYYPYYGYPYFYSPSFSFLFVYPGYWGYRGFYRYHGYVFAPMTISYRGGIIAHTFRATGRR